MKAFCFVETLMEAAGQETAPLANVSEGDVVLRLSRSPSSGLRPPSPPGEGGVACLAAKRDGVNRAKVFVLIVALVFFAEISRSMPFWTALAEIESGGNDYAVGDVGEISRYQIRPEVWKVYSSSKRFSDPAVALPIAQKYMAKLKRDFERATGRAATEEDCVVLWKSGIAGYEKRGFNPSRMSAAHKDRVIRFRNLRTEGLQLARAPAQKPAVPPVIPVETKSPEIKITDTVFFNPVGSGRYRTTFFAKNDDVARPSPLSGMFTRTDALPERTQSIPAIP